MNPHEVIIVGAGVSGLAAALALKKRGSDVVVLEAQSRVGGVAHTFLRDGFLCEAGPNTLMLSNPDVSKFLQEADILNSALDAAPHAQKRFLVQKGGMIPLPLRPATFLRSGLLSWKAIFRILGEPFIPSGKDEDETVAQFIRRRLGEEPLRELVNPFLTGIHAGDPERLIMRHVFPRLTHLEQTHGNLIRGAISERRRVKPGNRLLSWPGGLSELCEGMAAPLRERIRLSTPVRSIENRRGRFIIGTGQEQYEAAKVIVAVDALQAGRLLKPIWPEANHLEEMPHASMAVVHLGFSRSTIGHPLDGFGVLINRARGIRTLGALFSSTLFPGRTPEGHALLTLFIGGRLDPEAVALDDTTLVQIGSKDLAPLLQISGPPVFQQITRWPLGIPQYERDYSLILKTCESAESTFPGLYLIGSYRGGISLGDCLAHGIELGKRI